MTALHELFLPLMHGEPFFLKYVKLFLIINSFNYSTWHVVQFSHSVVSDSLWSHGLQHARLPCPSPTPGACSNSCPSSQWCYPTISSSVIPFSFCLQSFPASGSFPVSLTQWNYEPCHVGPPKTDASWWRVLTKCGLLEKGLANHFSSLTLRIPWTVWKGKKIWHQKRTYRHLTKHQETKLK